MSADILIAFQLLAQGGNYGQESTKRCTDWYDFADWVKEENTLGRRVLIIEWKYVHAVKKE